MDNCRARRFPTTSRPYFSRRPLSRVLDRSWVSCRWTVIRLPLTTGEQRLARNPCFGSRLNIRKQISVGSALGAAQCAKIVREKHLQGSGLCSLCRGGDDCCGIEPGKRQTKKVTRKFLSTYSCLCENCRFSVYLPEKCR